MKNYERIENDKGEENLLEFKWVTSEELKDIDLRPMKNISKAGGRALFSNCT